MTIYFDNPLPPTRRGGEIVPYLALGVVCILIALLVPLPYVLYVILLVVGVLALIYGLWILFTARRSAPPPVV